MLEKPDLQDDRIIDALRDTYGLRVAELAFLPLGADVNTAVYRVVGEDGTAYFVKLRSGIFNEITVLITRFLNEQGIEQIIPPLATTTGELWISVEDFKMVLYPFVEGHNGYEVELSDQHWRDLGKALKRVHTAQVPPELRVGIPNESYSPEWRDSVKRFLVDDDRALTDTVAVELAAFLQEKRAEILDLVGRAERLAQELQSQLETLVLCHADIHAGNGLIDKTGTLYLVDWDTLIFAPKERDLMFVGGGCGAIGALHRKKSGCFMRDMVRRRLTR